MFVPLLVFVLTRVNKTYEHEEQDLEAGLDTIQRPLPQRHVALVLVDRLDEKTLHALQYAFTIRPEDIRAVHLATDPQETTALRQAWRESQIEVPLEVIRARTASAASASDGSRAAAPLPTFSSRSSCPGQRISPSGSACAPDGAGPAWSRRSVTWRT